MKNKIADGQSLTWTNDTGNDVASGDIVVIGALVGIASSDIADTASGEVVVQEGLVAEVPLAPSLTVAQGAALYASATSAALTTTATSNVFAGHAYEAVNLATDVVKVRLARGAPG